MSTEVEIQTVEELGTDPWLTGLTGGQDQLLAELLKVETVSERPSAGIIKRRYLFLIRFQGPAREEDFLAFHLQEAGRIPSSKPSKGIHIRSTLIPAIASTD